MHLNSQALVCVFSLNRTNQINFAWIQIKTVVPHFREVIWCKWTTHREVVPTAHILKSGSSKRSKGCCEGCSSLLLNVICLSDAAATQQVEFQLLQRLTSIFPLGLYFINFLNDNQPVITLQLCWLIVNNHWKRLSLQMQKKKRCYMYNLSSRALCVVSYTAAPLLTRNTTMNKHLLHTHTPLCASSVYHCFNRDTSLLLAARSILSLHT